MAVRPETTYRASFYAKAAPGFSGQLTVTLENHDGSTVFARAGVAGLTGEWKKHEVKLTTGKAFEPSVTNRPRASGRVWLWFGVFMRLNGSEFWMLGGNEKKRTMLWYDPSDDRMRYLYINNAYLPRKHKITHNWFAASSPRSGGAFEFGNNAGPQLRLRTSQRLPDGERRVMLPS